MYLNQKQATTLQEENNSFYGSYETGALKDVKSHNYTSYLEEHYAELALKAERQPYVDPTKVGDILNDMWISFHLREMNGIDFNESYVNRNGEQVDIDSAVNNTLVQYAKNDKYHVDYNGVQKVRKGCGLAGEITMVPITEALMRGNRDKESSKYDKGSGVEYHALSKASAEIGGFNPTEDMVYDTMAHSIELKEAIGYALISTEGFQVSLKSIMDNMDMLLDRVQTNRKVISDPAKDDLIQSIHSAMFSEYTADRDLEDSFRVIFAELCKNRDNLMNVYSDVCNEVYAMA